MKALRDKRQAELASAQAIVEKAKTDKRGLSAEEATQVDAHIAEAERIKGTLERSEQLDAITNYRAPESQRTSEAPATTASDPSSRTAGSEVDRMAAAISRIVLGADRSRLAVDGDDPRGYGFARVAQCLALGNGDQAKVVAIAGKRYGERSPEYAALAAGDFTGGGALVRGAMAVEVIELLRARSAVRRLNPTVIPMNEGSQTLPAFSAGSAGTYIGENKNVPKTEPTFRQVKFSDKFNAGLVPISNSLLRTASPNVDRLIRDDMVAALVTRSDQAFIRDDGSANTPKGLRYSAIAANIFATAGTTLANVRTDIRKAQQGLLNNNVRMIRPGWIFAPRTYLYLRWDLVDANSNLVFANELDRGLFGGWPYAFSTNVPINLGGGANESEIYFADFADVVIAEAESIMLAVSDTAAYDDNGTVKASFSLNQTVIRAIEVHDFGVRHQESVVVVTGVTYGA
jgi:HK97 family phage major capsid protein